MSLEPIILALQSRGEKALALSVLEAFNRHSHHYEEYDECARIAFKIKEYTRAIKYAENAWSNALTSEKLWVARSNLINLYNHANHPEKALRLIRANEAVMPDDMDTRLEKAFSLFLMGDRDSAEAILKSEALRTDLTEEVRTKIMFNIGTYELYRDNFLYGLELFFMEGQKMSVWKKPELPGEFWMGQKVEPGTELLVYAEAGIGDEVISIRFLKHLKHRGIDPIWYTDRKDLARIFENSGFKVITNMRDRPLNSMWTNAMTLPMYLEVGYKDLWSGPYIVPQSEFVTKFNTIRKDTCLNIGLRWQGNPEYDHDLHRSVPLIDMVNSMPVDANLVALQLDTGLEELDKFPDIIDTSKQLKTFEDTLGVIANLDIVVTTCTSVAHMAAASGKRTFIFVPIGGYYVWSHSAKQSPWYGDNVTLLRQVKPRCWEQPCIELKEHLAALK